jgi:hypothetical protein
MGYPDQLSPGTSLEATVTQPRPATVSMTATAHQPQERHAGACGQHLVQKVRATLVPT